MKIIFRFIIRHSTFILAITALLTAISLIFIPRINMDNSVDVFFDKNNKSYIDFQVWKEQFGSDNLIIVAFKDTDIFTIANLELLSRLTSRFENLANVRRVISLANVNDIIGQEKDFIVQPFIEKIPSQPWQLKELKEKAISNHLYVNNIISQDGTATAIIIELVHKVSKDNVYKSQVLEEVNSILKEDFPTDKKYFVSGLTAIEVLFAKYMQNDFILFLPLMLGILLVILILSFRSLAGVLLPLSVTLISLAWTMALLYLCGYSINNVTTVIPPLMMSIALLESIHFLWELILKTASGLRRDGKINSDSLLVETMEHLFPPCFLTNVTTVVGFFALMVSRIPPIRQLGFVVGVGVLFAFVVTFSFLPAAIKRFNLLPYLYKIKNSGDICSGELYGFTFLKEMPDKAMMAMARFSVRHKMLILILSTAIMATSLWYTFKIKTETSVIEYFNKNSDIRRSTAFIEDNISGVHTLVISLKTEKEDFFKEPATLRAMENIQKFLKTFKEVDKSTSLVDYVKEMNMSFHNEDRSFYSIPDSRDLIAQYMLLYSADDLERFVDSRYEWASIRVYIHEHSTTKLENIIKAIDNYLKDNIGHGVTATVLGETVLEVDSNQAVTSGQIQSLSLAFVVIFAMMFINFRSWSLGILSIFPNILPLLMNFGLLGLLAIRLDSATSMIADVGIGIVVDDTIHFFHSYAEGVKETGDRQSSIYRSFLAKGRPTLITSFILMLGFGVVSFSEFVPTHYFGVLSSLLIFNGLWVELFLTPALLAQFGPRLIYKPVQG